LASSSAHIQRGTASTHRVSFSTGTTGCMSARNRRAVHRCTTTCTNTSTATRAPSSKSCARPHETDSPASNGRVLCSGTSPWPTRCPRGNRSRQTQTPRPNRAGLRRVSHATLERWLRPARTGVEHVVKVALGEEAAVRAQVPHLHARDQRRSQHSSLALRPGQTWARPGRTTHTPSLRRCARPTTGSGCHRQRTAAAAPCWAG
jgi:hypothetical protein